MTTSRNTRRWFAVASVSALALSAGIWAFVATADAPAGTVSQQAQAPTVTLNETELAAAAAFRPFSGTVPVVAYHDITDVGSIDSITPEQFAAQMAMLDEAGFMTVTLGQVHDLAMGRAVELPSEPILLTFDGGDLSTWVHADPILAQHGYTGVEFVATSELPTKLSTDHLDVDTLRRMIDTGRWEIGGNTHLGDQLVATDTGAVPWLVNRLTIGGHTETIDEWRQRVDADLQQNKEQLRDRLGVEPLAMSYPTPLNAPVDGDPELTPLLPGIVGSQFDLGFITGENPTSVDDSSVVTSLQRIRGFDVNTDPIALLGAIHETLPRSAIGSVEPTAWVIGGQGQCLFADGILVIADEGYTTCRLQTATADRWLDVRTSAQIAGISLISSASIRVRDIDISRLEVTVTGSVLIVDRVEGEVHTRLATAPIDLAVTNGATPILVQVRGTVLMVTVGGLPPLIVDVPPPTAPGAVSFAATTSGAGVITFSSLDIATFARPESGTQ